MVILLGYVRRSSSRGAAEEQQQEEEEEVEAHKELSMHRYSEVESVRVGSLSASPPSLRRERGLRKRRKQEHTQHRLTQSK